VRFSSSVSSLPSSSFTQFLAFATLLGQAQNLRFITMKCHRRCSSPTSLTSWLTIVLVAVVAPAPSSSQDFGNCKNANAMAETQIRSTPCGSLLPHSCPASACVGNFDGEGSEVAACVVDLMLYNPDFGDGVCALYVTSGAWAPTSFSSWEGTNIYLYRSDTLQGEVSWSLNTQGSCSVEVNGVECGACKLVQCFAGDTVLSIQADCTNLGQGTFDFCDKENYGSPGDLLKWLTLPYTCTSDSVAAPTPAGVCGQVSDTPIPPFPAPPPFASTPPSRGTPTRVSSGSGLMELTQAQSLWMLAVAGALVSYVL
jgi:hypothetical protein